MHSLTLREVLDHGSFLVQIAGNVAVAFYVFPMWKKTRLRFFLIFGCAALLNVFLNVFSMAWSKQVPDVDYGWYWNAMMALWIVDLILFPVAIIMMAQHFKLSARQPDVPPNPPENSPPPPSAPTGPTITITLPPTH